MLSAYGGRTVISLGFPEIYAGVLRVLRGCAALEPPGGNPIGAICTQRASTRRLASFWLRESEGRRGPSCRRPRRARICRSGSNRRGRTRWHSPATALASDSQGRGDAAWGRVDRIPPVNDLQFGVVAPFGSCQTCRLALGRDGWQLRRKGRHVHRDGRVLLVNCPDVPAVLAHVVTHDGAFAGGVQMAGRLLGARWASLNRHGITSIRHRALDRSINWAASGYLGRRY